MKAFVYFLFVGVASLATAAHAGAFTKESAPDAVSKIVLTQRLTKLDEGAPKGVDASPTIHRNFTQIIEQNFAELSQYDAAKLLDGLSDAELSDLAQLYINAASDNGNPARLFNILANRLDAKRLNRVSQHFGFTVTYSAIAASAPNKIQDFLSQANPNRNGPVPGELRFGANGRYAPQKLQQPNAMYSAYRIHNANYIVGGSAGPRFVKTAGGFGQFMNYTPYEIYLSFRTAPIGALAVEGALYETAVVLSSTLLPAYGTGYAIGTYVVNPLINNYAPNLGNAIGASVAAIVDVLSNSWTGGTSISGQAQMSAATSFMVSPAQYTGFSTLSGDFGVTSSFTDYVSSGGSCFTRSKCPPIELH